MGWAPTQKLTQKSAYNNVQSWRGPNIEAGGKSAYNVQVGE
ncbi:hypothetical protein ACVQ90_05830 [Staphylococcus aureus]